MEEGLPKVPKLELTQLKFLLQKNPKNASEIKQKLMNGITADSTNTTCSAWPPNSISIILIDLTRYDTILQ